MTPHVELTMEEFRLLGAEAQRLAIGIALEKLASAGKIEALPTCMVSVPPAWREHFAAEMFEPVYRNVKVQPHD